MIREEVKGQPCLFLEPHELTLSKFPVIQSLRFSPRRHIFEKIYPLKQRDANTLIDLAAETVRVQKAIVFGSSVTDRCTAYSDFDIALKIDTSGLSDIDYYKLLDRFHFANGGTDVIDLDKVKGHRIESEIAKGVVVYER